MILRPSDRALAQDLAADAALIAELEKIGPVPDAMFPLAESYLLFLLLAPRPRYQAPPAIQAFWQAHAACGMAYDAFCQMHPHLNRGRPPVQMADPARYAETRAECLSVLDRLDPRIWPHPRARSLGALWRLPKMQRHVLILVILCAIAYVPISLGAFTSALVFAPAIYLLLAIVPFVIRAYEWRTVEEFVSNPDRLRQGLLCADGAVGLVKPYAPIPVFDPNLSAHPYHARGRLLVGVCNLMTLIIGR